MDLFAAAFAWVNYRGADEIVMLVPLGNDAGAFASINQPRQAALDFEDIFRHSFDGIFVADGAGYTLRSTMAASAITIRRLRT